MCFGASASIRWKLNFKAIFCTGHDYEWEQEIPWCIDKKTEASWKIIINAKTNTRNRKTQKWVSIPFSFRYSGAVYKQITKTFLMLPFFIFPFDYIQVLVKLFVWYSWQWGVLNWKRKRQKGFNIKATACTLSNTHRHRAFDHQKSRFFFATVAYFLYAEPLWSRVSCLTCQLPYLKRPLFTEDRSACTVKW